jgi:hypothetical protein
MSMKRKEMREERLSGPECRMQVHGRFRRLSNRRSNRKDFADVLGFRTAEVKRDPSPPKTGIQDAGDPPLRGDNVKS